MKSNVKLKAVNNTDHHYYFVKEYDFYWSEKGKLFSSAKGAAENTYMTQKQKSNPNEQTNKQTNKQTNIDLKWAFSGKTAKTVTYDDNR